jgi:large subunit ribosomal protein L10
LAITKESKQKLVAQYQEQIEQSQGLIMASCIGLTVKEFQELRARLRESGGSLSIVKNTLAKIAFENAGIHISEEMWTGPTAIGFAGDDVPAVAKALVDLSRSTKVVQIKGAFVDGVEYTADQVKQLADLPTLPVLQAQFLSLLQTPATRIAGSLAGSIRQVVNVVNAYSEKSDAAEAA